MISRVDDGVHVVGHHAYRKPGYLRRALILLVLGGLMCFVAGRQVVASFPDDTSLSTIMIFLFALGGYFATIGGGYLWAWSSRRVDRFEISKRGITYGVQHWAWDRVTAIRIRALPPAAGFWAIQIQLRTGRWRSRCSSPCFIDGRITAEQRAELVSRINRLCEDARVEVS